MTVPTRFARLTPAGAGAIATVAVAGPRAWEVARTLFRPAGKPLPDAPAAGRFWFGTLGGAGAADEVVLGVPRVEPWPWVEVHCHGGREVVRMIGELFEQAGCTPCDWQELFRAVEPDHPLRSLAREELVKAVTERTAAILLDQMNGAFESEVATVVAAIDRGDAGDAGRLLDELARFAPLGRHLTDPWRVAVAGPPNVGKSSLVNALAGYQRSIVSATAGTTRDVVTVTLALDGWPVELADTAGVRESAEELERLGIARARQASAESDLTLWLFDATEPPVHPEPDGRHLFVVNKTDQPPAWDLDTAGGAVRVSARTGDGLPDLIRAVVQRLVPDVPTPGAGLPFTPGLCDALAEVRRLVASGATSQARLALATLPNSGERPA
jgi:tRNA modification GTPase